MKVQRGPFVTSCAHNSAISGILSQLIIVAIQHIKRYFTV